MALLAGETQVRGVCPLDRRRTCCARSDVRVLSHMRLSTQLYFLAWTPPAFISLFILLESARARRTARRRRRGAWAVAWPRCAAAARGPVASREGGRPRRSQTARRHLRPFVSVPGYGTNAVIRHRAVEAHAAPLKRSMENWADARRRKRSTAAARPVVEFRPDEVGIEPTCGSKVVPPLFPSEEECCHVCSRVLSGRVRRGLVVICVHSHPWQANQGLKCAKTRARSKRFDGEQIAESQTATGWARGMG